MAGSGWYGPSQWPVSVDTKLGTHSRAGRAGQLTPALSQHRHSFPAPSFWQDNEFAHKHTWSLCRALQIMELGWQEGDLLGSQASCAQQLLPNWERQACPHLSDTREIFTFQGSVPHLFGSPRDGSGDRSQMQHFGHSLSLTQVGTGCGRGEKSPQHPRVGHRPCSTASSIQASSCCSPWSLLPPCEPSGLRQGWKEAMALLMPFTPGWQCLPPSGQLSTSPSAGNPKGWCSLEPPSLTSTHNPGVHIPLGLCRCLSLAPIPASCV